MSTDDQWMSQFSWKAYYDDTTGMGLAENDPERRAEFEAEWRTYEGSQDPLEQWLFYRGSKMAGEMRVPILNPETGEPTGYSKERPQPGDSTEHFLSAFVINPMGMPSNAAGGYSNEDLRYIYTMTPEADIAAAIAGAEAEGKPYKAEWLTSLYSNVPDRPLVIPPGSPAGTEGTPSAQIIAAMKGKYGHGQTDVAMNPDLVNQMMSRVTTERQQHTYKGGTVRAGVLVGAPVGFKRKLGE